MQAGRSVTLVTLANWQRSIGREALKLPQINHEVPTSRILHHPLPAQKIESRRDALAARDHHLGDFFLRKIRWDLNQRIGVLTDFVCETYQYLCKALNDAIRCQCIDLRISLFQRTAENIDHRGHQIGPVIRISLIS